MGQSYLYIKCKHHNCEGLYIVVQSTTSMRSMLLLGGLGACPPRKILKILCSEIESESILSYNYVIVAATDHTYYNI